jgi:4-hydroxy-2-oxoheptanedioate aldolase
VATIKQRLKAGEVLVGTGGNIWTDNTVLADGGYDFIFLDTQHTPVEIKQLKPAFDQINPTDTTPIVRVAGNDYHQIISALDMGARGIIVPMVSSREEAENMVNACLYSPLGDRSNSGVRGVWGKEFPNYRDYLDYVNEELLIIPMIETKRAIENIDDILSVDGIDVYLIGPSDLSIELGVPLDWMSDEYQRGLDQIVEGCVRNGVVPGMYFIPPGLDPNFFIDKGFKFFTWAWQPHAAEGIKSGLSTLKRG